jgi:hypothetical protein
MTHISNHQAGHSKEGESSRYIRLLPVSLEGMEFDMVPSSLDSGKEECPCMLVLSTERVVVAAAAFLQTRVV